MRLHCFRRANILVGLALLVAVVAGDQSAFAIRNLKVGDPMPDFLLPRADQTAGAYALAQLKGQPAAVIFWRPGQKMSREAVRDLQTIAAEIGAAKVRILGVETSRLPTPNVEAASAGGPFSFPIVRDPQRDLYGKVGVIVCPTTLLLDAQGVLRFVVVSHPQHFSRVVRARLRFLVGEIGEAEMNREIEPTVLKIDHDLAAVWRMQNLGRKLQAKGRSNEAVTIYEKAVAQYPALPEARCALGFMKLAAGDLNTAAQHFQTALTYQPSSADARLGQAAVLARTGQSKQAEQILLSLLGRKSIAVRVRYELGSIYQARGELDKAVAYYQDALNMLFPGPNNSSTRAAAPSATVQPSRTPAIAIQPSRTPAAVSRPPKLVAPRPVPTPAPAATGLPPRPVPTPAPATTRVPPGTGATSGQPPKPAQTGAIQNIEPIRPPAGARLVGIKRCKKCHLQQWKSWDETKMSKAWEILKPGQRDKEKTTVGLDPGKDYSTDPKCLACHTNGFGLPGGYAVPAPGDTRAAMAARNNAGIGCESCHGPGEKYSVVHEEIENEERTYTQAEFYEAGQYEMGAPVCAACHRPQEAPCIGSEYTFDFEKRKEEGTHKHYDLKFRAK